MRENLKEYQGTNKTARAPLYCMIFIKYHGINEETYRLNNWTF